MVAFRSATAVTSLLGNPVGAMTMTAMVSIISLDSCIYSDVDPLDSSISPIQVAIGPELGQYYRGASVLALAVYAGGIVAANFGASVLSRLGKTERSHDACMAVLRFPSVGMIAVGLAGEGLASCGVALLRLHSSTWDVILGALSLTACVLVAAWALYVTTGSRLKVRVQRSDVSCQVQALPSLIRPLARHSLWKLHYVDMSGTGFKRRHMMLIDGLLHPWWTAVELSSAVFQGAILGIRVSSPTVCRAQRWVMLAQTGAMMAAAWYVKPFGAPMANAFLAVSKFSAFVVVLLVVVDEGLGAVAEVVTTVATAVGACEVLLSMFILLFTLRPQLAQAASGFFRFRAACQEDPAALPAPEVELDDLFIHADLRDPFYGPAFGENQRQPVERQQTQELPTRDGLDKTQLWYEVVGKMLARELLAAGRRPPPRDSPLHAIVLAACKGRDASGTDIR